MNGSNLKNGTVSLSGAKKQKNEFLEFKNPLDLATIRLSINGTLGDLSFYNMEAIILEKIAAYISLVEREMYAWVSLFLKSKITWDHFQSDLIRITINSIPLSAIRSLCIAIPPLVEQKKNYK